MANNQHQKAENHAEEVYNTFNPFNPQQSQSAQKILKEMRKDALANQFSPNMGLEIDRIPAVSYSREEKKEKIKGLPNAKRSMMPKKPSINTDKRIIGNNGFSANYDSKPDTQRKISDPKMIETRQKIGEILKKQKLHFYKNEELRRLKEKIRKQRKLKNGIYMQTKALQKWKLIKRNIELQKMLQQNKLKQINSNFNTRIK